MVAAAQVRGPAAKRRRTAEGAVGTAPAEAEAVEAEQAEEAEEAGQDVEQLKVGGGGAGQGEIGGLWSQHIRNCTHAHTRSRRPCTVCQRGRAMPRS